MKSPEILLVYDKVCPLCHAYCQLVRIRGSVGDLKIVDAREDSEVLQEITDNGLDIDQGMVLKMGDKLYYGVDAIHMLALISQRSGVFNRINYRIFSSRRLAFFLYPVFRFFETCCLKYLARPGLIISSFRGMTPSEPIIVGLALL